jgi:hypothetical protein
MRVILGMCSFTLSFHSFFYCFASKVVWSGKCMWFLPLPIQFGGAGIYIYIYVCVGVCACARAHALNALAQTMIAANSCMTLFLSFSLSLVHQLKVERAIIVCVGTNALVLSQITSNVLITNSKISRSPTQNRTRQASAIIPSS